jgi:hypothetical protein
MMCVNVKQIVALFVFGVVLFSGCTSHKLRLHNEEIKRPLSLPPGNWRIGAGAGPFFNSGKTPKQSLELDVIFNYPYFQFGKNVEYYLPATFKCYISKNVETKDSVMSISGMNCAVSAGLVGWSYSQFAGSVFTFAADVDFKKPVSDKLWMVAKALVNYSTYRSDDVMSGLTIGIGCQLSDKIYTTFTPTLFYNNHTKTFFGAIVNLETCFELYGIGREGFSTSFPMVLGVNLTKTLSLYWRNNVHLYFNGSTQYSSVLGLYFTF